MSDIIFYLRSNTCVYLSDEKKGSPPKVVIEESKSLELNITNNDPVQIQVRKTATKTSPNVEVLHATLTGIFVGITS